MGCLVTIVGGSLAAVANAADRVYWGGYGSSTPKISFANLNGSGGADLNTTGATVDEPFGLGIDVARGKIYWANDAGNQISFAKLDGSGGGGDLNTSGATMNNPEGFAIDPIAGKVYWANISANKISFARLDGSGGGGDLNTTGATVDRPKGLAIDRAAGRIYWADSSAANKISFAKLDGSGGGGDLNTSGATVSSPSGVAIDRSAGRIYWTNEDPANKISFANLNGTGGGGDLNTSGTTVTDPIGLAIDPVAGRLYFANYGANKISFVNLNGSGGGDLSTTGATVDGPAMPTLLKTPSGTGNPAIRGPSAPGSILACSRGSWAPDLLGSFLYRVPQSFAYHWSRNGATIASAMASSYKATLAGRYRCRVSASNAAGTATQASAPHRVFAKATITKAEVNSAKSRAKFSFKSSAGANGFQCALIKREHGKKGKKPSFSACKSPKTYKGLQPGKYTFEVRALSAAGAGPAAKKSFNI